jgi:hypothetical protein
MKKLLSVLFITTCCGVAMAHENILVNTTNVTVTTEVSVVNSVKTPVTLEITDLFYVFKTDTLRVSLLYTIDGEVVATGRASVIPSGETDYKVTYHILGTPQPVVLTVPKVMLDSLGLAQGKGLVKQLAAQLGVLIAEQASSF